MYENCKPIKHIYCLVLHVSRQLNRAQLILLNLESSVRGLERPGSVRAYWYRRPDICNGREFTFSK